MISHYYAKSKTIVLFKNEMRKIAKGDVVRSRKMSHYSLYKLVP